MGEVGEVRQVLVEYSGYQNKIAKKKERIKERWRIPCAGPFRGEETKGRAS